MPRVSHGPKYVQFFDPMLKALKELGGSARPGEVVEVVARLKNTSEAQRQEVLKSGPLRFDNQIAFARQYLVWGGYLDSSKRGVWSLTEKGLASPGLTDAEALRLFNEQHALHCPASQQDEAGDEDESASAELPKTYKEQLLGVLRQLPASGFERLCQRLLRESGFERVQVTGQSGDGGIDGVGIVKVNAFVTFKVLFQCKRYAGGVSAGHVRDFRGAMQGRADKGIILTTGTFTKDAHAEAVRDGVPPIELVDGEQLVELFEQLELGLLPRTTYDVDTVFFEQFQGRAEQGAADLTMNVNLKEITPRMAKSEPGEQQADLPEDRNGGGREGIQIVIDWGALDDDRPPQTIRKANDTETIVELLKQLLDTFGKPMREQLLKLPIVRFPLSTNPETDFLNKSQNKPYGSTQIPGTDLYFCPQSERSQKVEKLKALFTRLTLPDGSGFPDDCVTVSIEGDE